MNKFAIKKIRTNFKVCCLLRMNCDSQKKKKKRIWFIFFFGVKK